MAKNFDSFNSNILQQLLCRLVLNCARDKNRK
jgi:hypothetical protein